MKGPPRLLTVNLNTAIDRVIEAPGLAVGEHLVGHEVSRYPAGKGINVSRALSRLGRDSVATGFVGQEEIRQFERYLSLSGPGRAQCQLLSVHGTTRENLTLLDPETNRDMHVRLAGFEVTEDDLKRMRTKLGLLVREGVTVVFSGSLPQGTGLADLGELAALVVRQGGKLVLDTGGNELSVLSGRWMPKAPAPPAWVISPNEDEVRAALGLLAEAEDRTVLAGARQMTAHATWVAVTRGRDGAWLIHDNCVREAMMPIDQSRIVNTVGCGDCFLAGLLDGQLAGQDPEQALRRAIAAATANALSAGVADFDRGMIDQLAPDVLIEKVG